MPNKLSVPNQYLLVKGVISITLHGGHTCLIDEQDVAVVNSYHWYAHRHKGGRSFYATAHTSNSFGRRTLITMHRLLFGFPKGRQVDHINHNGLDNRRSNLRLCSHAENHSNQRKQLRKTSSKFKGVTWVKKDHAWQAQIGTSTGYKFLGYFADELSAAKAYNVAALKHHGRFANVNNV